MTTTSQQTVLTEDELAALRAIAADAADTLAPAMREALAAKGMLATGDGAHCSLTPAGSHAIDVSGPGQVPGIDT